MWHVACAMWIADGRRQAAFVAMTAPGKSPKQHHISLHVPLILVAACGSLCFLDIHRFAF